jgi:arylamine N-acetyltransferase
VHQCPQYGIKQCGSRRSLLRPLYSSTRKRSGKYTSATGSDSDADGHLSAGSGTDSDCNDEAVRKRKATAQQATLQQTQTQTQTQPKHRKRLKTSSKADYNSALEALASRSCSLDELHNLNADARSAKLASLQLSDIHRSAITEMLKPKSLKKVSDSETIRTGALRMLDRNNLSLQYLSTLSADARFEKLQ